MTKLKLFCVSLLAFGAISFSSPSKAAVITYTLTFNDPDGAGPKNGGTGLLTLDVPSVPGSLNIGSGSSQFVGLTATINGESFVFSDIWNIGFSSGVLNNLSAQTPTGAPGTHYLQMAGPSFFRIGTVNAGDFVSSGTFSIGAPVVAAVPEISTWAMMLLGFAGLALVSWLGKRELRSA